MNTNRHTLAEWSVLNKIQIVRVSSPEKPIRPAQLTENEQTEENAVDILTNFLATDPGEKLSGIAHNFSLKFLSIE